MTWVKLDDHMSEHPKIAQAGPLASWLYVCALQYASRSLTDGFVPIRQVANLANFDGISVNLGSMLDGAVGLGDDVHIGALAETLVDVGLWEPAPGGYQIHDYLEYNPSKADVLAQRRQNAERQAAWKDRQRGSHNGTNGVANAGSNVSTNGTTNARTNAPTNGGSNAVSSSVTNSAPYPVPVPVPGTSRTETGNEDVPLSAESGARSRARTRARPESKSPNSWNHGPLIDAFRAEGLEAPVLAGRLESDAARKLLQHFAAPELATVWDAVVEQRWGDQYDRDHLSFAHLAERDRVRQCLGALARNGAPTTSVVQNDPRSPPRVKGWVEGRYYCLGLGCGWSGTPRPGDHCRLCETTVPERVLAEAP
jgi:hypothetical protein